LKLQYCGPPSNFAFNFNLRWYNSVEFRLDLAGTYVVKLTSRGLEPIIDINGKVNLGASVGAGLYELVVVPGRGLHSSAFQLNLSRFAHTSPRPPI
jgi:hypothetical protein